MQAGLRGQGEVRSAGYPPASLHMAGPPVYEPANRVARRAVPGKEINGYLSARQGSDCGNSNGRERNFKFVPGLTACQASFTFRSAKASHFAFLSGLFPGRKER